jgi:hypothetical protein
VRFSRSRQNSSNTLAWKLGGGKYWATFSLITFAEYAGVLRPGSINAILMINAMAKDIRIIFFVIGRLPPFKMEIQQENQSIYYLCSPPSLINIFNLVLIDLSKFYSCFV